MSTRSEEAVSTARVRDAARSREAILDAAEGLFAERGFVGASLQEIGAAAGLARATPSYFFGSKEGLYAEVLRRVLEAREDALRDAFSPLRRWAEDKDADRKALRDALGAAIGGYFAFLDGRRSFARLIEWEALSGAERLRETLGRSTAVSDALGAVHAVRASRGLADFDLTRVLVALVSLCFLPVAHAATFAEGAGIDTSGSEFRGAYQEQAVDVMVHLLTS